MSATARILDRLQRVKPTGPGRWLACCPAHEDHAPSLSIREVDGKVLIHDFGGCGAIAVLEAIGLKFSDLYDRPLPPSRPTHSRIPSRDVLLAMSHEVAVSAIIIEEAQNHPLSNLARDRLALAVGRIGSAAAYIRGLK